MSVTIRYHGSIADESQLRAMQDEFEDIARVNKWPSEIVDGSFSSLKSAGPSPKGGGVQTLSPPLTLKGVRLIVHPQTDPLWFTFDPTGQLTRLGYFAVDHYAPGARRTAQLTRRFEFVHQSQASIQTSVGGADLHKTVIHLLDRLKAAYAPNLEVKDESGYFDERDEARLYRVMEVR